MLFVLLLLVPAVLGFQSSFNYGCAGGKCTYQFVVPKEVAQYIDQNKLSDEVSTISNSLSTLNNTIINFGGANDTTLFTEKFNASFSVVNSAAQDLNSNVLAVSNNVSALVADSAAANSTAQLLYNSIDCFKGNASSYTCFSLPTTVAPAVTTQSVDITSTVNPATDGGSTVSQGSQPTVGSTVPNTGSPQTDQTTVPASAGTSGTSPTGQPASDSTDASPSTSAGSVSPSEESSATVTDASSPSTVSKD